MRQFDTSNLIVHPGNSNDPDVVVEVMPEQVGLEYIHFQVRRLQAQRTWSFETGEHELAVVLLSGNVGVESNRGRWSSIGERKDVFSAPPSALYLPRHTTFTVTAATDSEFAVAWVATDQDHEPRLVSPQDVPVEIRGGDNATRHINNIIPPGFDCHRLVVVEVYTPSGNWSSYPPHKHDIHKTDADGNVVEADLEEIYYYKLDRPEGFAFQRIYTAPESPLHRAGFPIDAALLARDNDVVLVPEGYHPVTSAPGYTTYYLNVLAGSAQSLANSEDPAHAWVKETYQTRDPRVPIYEVRREATLRESASGGK
jgi:5-deoxy-glucuronate isomerase